MEGIRHAIQFGGLRLGSHGELRAEQGAKTHEKYSESHPDSSVISVFRHDAPHSVGRSEAPAIIAASTPPSQQFRRRRLKNAPVDGSVESSRINFNPAANWVFTLIMKGRNYCPVPERSYFEFTSPLKLVPG